jgi:signal transduction histidine kinase
MNSITIVTFRTFYALNDAKKLEFHIHFEYSSAIDENTLNSEFEMKMYFNMELLNNVIKHSNAENTTLSLQEVENELLIHVRDNVVGFDTTNTI